MHYSLQNVPGKLRIAVRDTTVQKPMKPKSIIKNSFCWMNGRIRGMARNKMNLFRKAMKNVVIAPNSFLLHGSLVINFIHMLSHLDLESREAEKIQMVFDNHS